MSQERGQEKPLGQVGPWDAVAGGYRDVTAKHFRQYAEEALGMAGVDPDTDVLDVATGPGTLALLAAPRVHSVHAVDFSPNMIALLQDTIRQEGLENVEARVEDGQALSFEDERFDAAFSMFGLMFFPDRMKGHAEMLRTLRPGGAAVISSWAPIANSSLMRVLFEALQAIDPNIRPTQADVESIEALDALEREMLRAGYVDVEVRRVDGEMRYPTAEGFWRDLVKGSAPLVMMKQNVAPDRWEAMSATAVREIERRYGSEDLSFNALANLGIGRKRG